MITNDAGRQIVMSNELLRTKAYLCPAGIPTIGYGHTSDVTMADVKSGRTITAHEAEAILEVDLSVAENAVSKGAPVANGNQFSAMVSLTFNIGAALFASSTLLKRHNAGQYLNAAAEFDKWCHARDPKTGSMVVLPGLVKRRAQEKALYMQAVS